MTVDVEDGQSLQLRGVPGVGVLLGLVLRVDLQRQLGAAQRLGRAAVTDLLEGGVPAPLLDAGARDGQARRPPTPIDGEDRSGLEPRPRLAGVQDQADLPTQPVGATDGDRKSTRLNSSHVAISYAVFCL